MTKAVYRPGELELITKKVVLDPPASFPELAHLSIIEDETEEIDDAAEEYDGPTADDLRREADAFRDRWNAEREAMAQTARDEAAGIIKEAEQEAFRLVKKQKDDSLIEKQKAKEEAEAIIAEAREKAVQIEAEAKESHEKQKKEAEEAGRAAGRETGYTDGKAEADRLVRRVQTVLERANEKRSEILAEAEQEIVDLVLLISRKVIKVISESQKEIIIPNVIQALRKVKDRGNVIIKVNLSDLKLTTEHTKDFIQLLEGVKSIHVLEDSTIDEGGCIIETDFGEIDARISSQLAEIESRILDMSPIKSKSKAAAT